MLRRMLDRLRHPRSSVQYEVHRQTFRGGWKNYYGQVESAETTVFNTPPSPPEFTASSEFRPGSYRCIKRVNGRIATVVWERDSPDAESYYQEQWRKARQRERLKEMTTEDIWHELKHSTAFDALSQSEVVTEAVTKVTQQDTENQNGGETNMQLRDELVLAVAEEQGPQAAINELIDVMRAENELCAYCSSSAYDQCSICGELVCRQHVDPQQGVCSIC